MNKKIINFVSAIGLAFFLGGCEQLYWVSYEKNIEALDSDLRLCNIKAYQKFPPIVSQTIERNPYAAMYNSMASQERERYQSQLSARQTSLTTDCRKNPYGYSCQTNSSLPMPTHPVFSNTLPETEVVTVDFNKAPRDSFFTMCMKEKTWNLEYRKPKWF